MPVSFFLFFSFKYLFIWLRRVLVAARGIFIAGAGSLVAACGIFFSCGMQDLVPWPGIEPGPPALGTWSLNRWATREVPIPVSFLLFGFLSNKKQHRERLIAQSHLRDSSEPSFAIADESVSYGVTGASIPAGVWEAGCDLRFTVSPGELGETGTLITWRNRGAHEPWMPLVMLRMHGLGHMWPPNSSESNLRQGPNSQDD